MELKTIVQASKDLRKMAELTSKHSQNWDNFEQIALKLLGDAFEGGIHTERDRPKS